MRVVVMDILQYRGWILWTFKRQLNISFLACLCRRRDRARLEMNRIFGEVIQARRASKRSPDEEEEDVLGILLTTTYKWGLIDMWHGRHKTTLTATSPSPSSIPLSILPCSLLPLPLSLSISYQEWSAADRWWNRWDVDWVSPGWPTHLLFHEYLARVLPSKKQEVAGLCMCM